VTALGDGSHFIQPSLLVPCPKFHWDDYTLSGPDSFPSTHCGSMFASSLPLPPAMLAPGAHALRLVLHQPPASSRMSCSPPFCGDSVSFHVRASSPSAASDNVLPGGAAPCSARLIFCNHRQALSQAYPKSSTAYGSAPLLLHPGRCPARTSAIGRRGGAGTSPMAGNSSRGPRLI
jgi:hypothetical protein